MTHDITDDLPGNWTHGIGEASRPLHEGGHYQHLYYRTLPGSNQHHSRFLEIVSDTAGQPPTQHVVGIEYCTEDDVEVHRHKTLDVRRFDVEPPSSEAEQRHAEEQADEAALELMREYADWTP